MTKNERQQKILDFMLYHNKVATIEQLRDLCAVTTETIRKDLIEMEKQKKIYRILGGAVLYEKVDERSFSQRHKENINLKMEIAQKAMSLIEDKDFIALDAGSTNLSLAMDLLDKEISVLTNSLDIARELSKNENVRLFVIGGELRATNMSMTGQAAENMIGGYRVRKAFLTSEGVGLDYGVMDAHESESRVKRAIISVATEKYLLVDHTKFSVVTPIYTSSLKDITAIITDSGIDEEVVRQYEKAGVKIIVAE